MHVSIYLVIKTNYQLMDQKFVKSLQFIFPILSSFAKTNNDLVSCFSSLQSNKIHHHAQLKKQIADRMRKMPLIIFQGSRKLKSTVPFVPTIQHVCEWESHVVLVAHVALLYAGEIQICQVNAMHCNCMLCFLKGQKTILGSVLCLLDLDNHLFHSA